MATQVNNPAWLEWVTGLMGGVSRQAHSATFPPDRYYCLLDELPLHLLPQRGRQFLQATGDAGGHGLFFNPNCSVRAAEDLPEELIPHGEPLSAFALQGTIAWVRDLAGSLPFWLGPELSGVVRRLQANEMNPQSLPAETRQLLLGAGILISEDRVALAAREREETVRATAAQFVAKGYAPIGGPIHPLHMAAMRRYYRYLLRKGKIRLGDGQSPRRYVAHNDPVARFFHHRIAFTLSAIAGETVKPSYVYLASYLSGAELKKHTDREQCEFSCTLCLDFSPEPELATAWPISLDTPTGTATVYQAIGDALAYRGTKLPHYRGPLGEGHTSTSIFFHYVAADFAGSLG
jgi:hypothetical protein